MDKFIIEHFDHLGRVWRNRVEVADLADIVAGRSTYIGEEEAEQLREKGATLTTGTYRTLCTKRGELRIGRYQEEVEL